MNEPEVARAGARMWISAAVGIVASWAILICIPGGLVARGDAILLIGRGTAGVVTPKLLAIFGVLALAPAVGAALTRATTRVAMQWGVLTAFVAFAGLATLAVAIPLTTNYATIALHAGSTAAVFGSAAMLGSVLMIGFAPPALVLGAVGGVAGSWIGRLRRGLMVEEPIAVPDAAAEIAAPGSLAALRTQTALVAEDLGWSRRLSTRQRTAVFGWMEEVAAYADSIGVEPAELGLDRGALLEALDADARHHAAFFVRRLIDAVAVVIWRPRPSGYRHDAGGGPATPRTHGTPVVRRHRSSVRRRSLGGALGC